MEDQLHQASDWSSHSTAQSPNFDDVTEQNSDAAITKLACQVEEQVRIYCNFFGLLPIAKRN